MSNTTTIPITNQHLFSPPPWPEVSPALLGDTAFVTTDHSYQCKWQNNTLTCERLVTSRKPEVRWRRSYAGVFAAENINGRVITFIHGENKNEIVNGEKLHNTVSSDTSCWSGVQADGSYRDCWQDYFAFISVAADGQDRGPIIWPKNGYLNWRKKAASHGVRHPTTLVAKNHVYVFYVDTSVGLCVARSPLTSGAEPGTFNTWTSKGWVPALPSNPNRLRKKGPNAKSILDNGTNTYFFAVATTFDGYIGLGFETPTRTSFGTQVWTSKDLLHWERQGWPMWRAHGIDPADAYDHLAVRYARPISAHQAIATTGAEVILISW